MTQRRRALRADASRNAARLRDVAVEVFINEGFDSPLEEIARRAGVSIGTLYNRFGGRSGLLNAVVVVMAQEALRSCLAAAEAQGTPWSRFKTFLEGVCELQCPSPTLSEDITEKYFAAARSLAVSEPTLTFGEDLVRAAQADGALRRDFVRDDLERVIWSQGSLIGDRVGEPDGWRRSVQFILDGLRVVETSGSRQ